ncbi:tryptophan--tRNA ligase [Knufia obscura]|uniref:Tryptophan--tRNA ligase, cytoplasmic n=2 Tax=Knufia TaxID=430999 RepID=A0AAN8E9D7_9EURO|nr:tryptophan--tRNA ligase [Knufia obscura]KAK5948963.1 tryptophan--tRNA ligase [Knufia fluminis]
MAATVVPDEPGQPPKLTQDALASRAPKQMAADQVVNPFEVSGGMDEAGKALAIDFDKIVRDFGATPMSPEILQRFERVTGKKPHRLMRRGMVSSHRDLDKMLDRYEKGEPFYLYTGRGPSSDSMHVGHAMPFELTRFLQEAFNCPLVIMLTDDEKFMHSEKLTIEDAKRFSVENAKDIIALGFDPKKTFIFSDFEFVSGAFYENICMIAKHITINQIKGTFGFDDSTNIGKFHFPATQSATAYATSFPHIFGHDKTKARQIPCLIPCAIDQDPYFRQCRDRAEKMKHKKPAILHMIFLPALQGPGSKMSASVSTSAIFLSDKPNEIKNKINKYAFSGGQDTAEKQKELGGRTAVDVPYQYLTFFLEDDDELARIKDDYEHGRMMTGEIKKICIQYVQEFVAQFQERRKKVDESVSADFFARKPLLFQGKTAEEVINDLEEKKKQEKAEKKAKADAEKAAAKAAAASADTSKADAPPADAEAKSHKKTTSTVSVGRTKQ